MPYQLLADAVLLVHFGVVLFIIGGLAAIVLGGVRHWSWTRNRWFRWLHLGAIGLVVLQAWLGLLCPLTVLEAWLRTRAGSTTYHESFIEHWVQRVLFYTAPFWVFAIVYTVFGLLVVLAWWRVPPHRAGRAAND
jgi:hypothetical protein